VEAEVNAAIDPRREPPLRFLVLDGPPGPTGTASVLVMSWFHPLMDPRGAQNLLGHLGVLDARPDGAPGDATVSPFVAMSPARPLRERGRLARQSVAHMRSLSGAPSVTPRPARPGPVRFRHASFVAGSPAVTGERPSREIWWRLAVVGKALREVWVPRGLADVPVLLPIAVDLRPKGEPGPTFGNMLAFHFARFAPADTADVPRLAGWLRSQMADAVREGLIEANEVAMTFLQHRPLWMIRRAMRGISSGDAFSFNCADVGELPAALAGCFGRRVVNAYHVPAVPPRPGIGVFFNRGAGRNNLVVAWIDGVLSEDDVTRIVEIVREEMGWVETR
jgi:hypothetical protein